jgi:hypothetical protein
MPSQLAYLTTESQQMYLKTREWFEDKSEYLKQTKRDLTRTQQWETPDTYRNLKLTETLLESQLKFASLWFNEIWRWFPITQYGESIRDIVIDAINLYIHEVPLPHYTLEQGLVTPFKEIEITVQVDFKESHNY